MAENRPAYELAVRCFNFQMDAVESNEVYIHDVMSLEADVARLRADKKALEDARDALPDDNKGVRPDIVGAIEKKNGAIRAAAEAAERRRADTNYVTVEEQLKGERTKASEYLELASPVQSPW